MEGELNDLHWFKSSASASGGCVEVAHLPGGGVAVRDSKDRAKAPHVYTRREWEAFLTGAKNGEFDLPVALAGGASPGSPGSPGDDGDGFPPSAGARRPAVAATNAAHCSRPNSSAGPAGCREFLTATRPSPRHATSTQLPPVGPLRVLFTQRAAVRPVASLIACRLQLP